jgi:hypothetical protein
MSSIKTGLPRTIPRTYLAQMGPSGRRGPAVCGASWHWVACNGRNQVTEGRLRSSAPVTDGSLRRPTFAGSIGVLPSPPHCSADCRRLWICCALCSTVSRSLGIQYLCRLCLAVACSCSQPGPVRAVGVCINLQSHVFLSIHLSARPRQFSSSSPSAPLSIFLPAAGNGAMGWQAEAINKTNQSIRYGGLG